MGHKFAEIAFTSEVKQVQTEQNSRAGYQRMEEGEDYNYLLSSNEADFIEDRDSFYMASVSETDWPYVQHRGGPKGFMRVLDASTIGFADYAGNRQYVSTGNLRKNNRVSLFFMDYINQRRLKILGHVSIIEDSDFETLSKLENPDFRAPVERGFLIHIDAFDWNCPKYITPRFTEAEVRKIIEPLQEELATLRDGVSSNGEAVSKAKDADIIGDGSLELTVTGIRQLTPDIRGYELRSLSGELLPKMPAGSNLEVPLKMEDGSIHYRHYSIASDPAETSFYEIAVLREEEGLGGSVAVHRSFTLGTKLACRKPTNNFALKTDLHKDGATAVLIAGGIGITPIKSMAGSLKATGADFELHYAGRSQGQMAFAGALQKEHGNRINLYPSNKGTRLDLQALLKSSAPDAVFYLCGPQRLIDAAISAAEALGIDPERVCYERFSMEISDTAKPVTVTLAKSGQEIHVPKDQTILDALIEADVPMNYSCKAGDCRSCVVKVVEGTPEHFDSSLSKTEHEKEGLFCPCVSRAHSEHLTLDL